MIGMKESQYRQVSDGYLRRGVTVGEESLRDMAKGSFGDEASERGTEGAFVKNYC